MSKTQVGDAQLDHLVPGAEAGQWQRRIFAGGDDQVHVRWEMLEQKGESLVYRFDIQHVVIVKDEDAMVG